MDGTFKMCPSLFRQVYVVRGDNGETTYTCIYALMAEKSKEAYKRLLPVVISKIVGLELYPKPDAIITDFEASAMLAVKDIFEDGVQVTGCFFHLCQNTFKHIQQHGLVKAYKTEPDVKLHCGMLDALAFLPVEDVKKGMEYLWATCPFSMMDVLYYFDTTYVSGVGGDNTKPPMFPPHCWNVHKATLADLHRTNNLCESWSNRFNTLVGHHNPSVWTVLEAFRKDEALGRTQSLGQNRPGGTSKRIENLKKHQRLLKRLCQEYCSGQRDLPSFLLSVGRTIRYE